MKSFNFPYKPYDIQIKYMETLYDTINKGKIGILDSPTGTGKTLSLICSSLTWLEENTDSYGILKSDSEIIKNELNPIKENEKLIDSTISKKKIEPEWLQNFSIERNQIKIENELIKESNKVKIKNIYDNIKNIKQSTNDYNININYNTFNKNHNYHPNKKIKKYIKINENNKLKDSIDETDTFINDENIDIVDNYTSEEENNENNNNINLDSDEEINNEEYNIKSEDLGIQQIIYCSRTHSQLSQFVKEIKKTKFSNYVTCITLGSRKNLCINKIINDGKRNDNHITDRCLDVIKKKDKTLLDHKIKNNSLCPYYNKKNIHLFQYHSLATIQDIEDLKKLGETTKTCSYYGTRKSIQASKVIAMPYSMLLSKRTRESIGLNLKNKIMIFDEAHNLIDAINQIHTIEITDEQIWLTYNQLSYYLKKFDKKLKGKNIFYIKQLLFILKALRKMIFLTNKKNIMKLTDFVFQANIDCYNFFKINRYLERSRLAQKLLGYTEKVYSCTKASDNELMQKMKDYTYKNLSPLNNIQSFLLILMESTDNGRIVVKGPNMNKKEINEELYVLPNNGYLKFISLNPSIYFEEIVKESRSIILTGGTMKPMSQFIDELFGEIPKNKINILSCDHVVPSENLIALIAPKGPTNYTFDFSYKNRTIQDNVNFEIKSHYKDQNDKVNSRMNVKLIDELGRLVLNISNIIKNGIVLFFPSYEYEETVMHYWEITNLLTTLKKKKTIYREPIKSDMNINNKNNKNNSVEFILRAYAKSACNIYENEKKSKDSIEGAILSCVMGGKLSEGIDFSDDLARCVIIVGLPYPNKNEPELNEKINYLNQIKSNERMIQHSGNVYYMNLCMKTVNQSIGRSIRHINDYSSIILVDKRFQDEHIIKELPNWIQKRIQPNISNFGTLYSSLYSFFKNKKNLKNILQ